MMLTRSNELTNEMPVSCLYRFVTLINSDRREQKLVVDAHALHLLVLACNKRFLLRAKYRKEQISPHWAVVISDLASSNTNTKMNDARPKSLNFIYWLENCFVAVLITCHQAFWFTSGTLLLLFCLIVIYLQAKEKRISKAFVDRSLDGNARRAYFAFERVPN